MMSEDSNVSHRSTTDVVTVTPQPLIRRRNASFRHDKTRVQSIKIRRAPKDRAFSSEIPLIEKINGYTMSVSDDAVDDATTFLSFIASVHDEAAVPTVFSSSSRHGLTTDEQDTKQKIEMILSVFPTLRLLSVNTLDLIENTCDFSWVNSQKLSEIRPLLEECNKFLCDKSHQMNFPDGYDPAILATILLTVDMLVVENEVESSLPRLKDKRMAILLKALECSRDANQNGGNWRNQTDKCQDMIVSRINTLWQDPDIEKNQNIRNISIYFPVITPVIKKIATLGLFSQNVQDLVNAIAIKDYRTWSDIGKILDSYNRMFSDLIGIRFNDILAKINDNTTLSDQDFQGLFNELQKKDQDALSRDSVVNYYQHGLDIVKILFALDVFFSVLEQKNTEYTVLYAPLRLLMLNHALHAIQHNKAFTAVEEKEQENLQKMMQRRVMMLSEIKKHPYVLTQHITQDLLAQAKEYGINLLIICPISETEEKIYAYSSVSGDVSETDRTPDLTNIVEIRDNFTVHCNSQRKDQNTSSNGPPDNQKPVILLRLDLEGKCAEVHVNRNQEIPPIQERPKKRERGNSNVAGELSLLSSNPGNYGVKRQKTDLRPNPCVSTLLSHSALQYQKPDTPLTHPYVKTILTINQQLASIKEKSITSILNDLTEMKNRLHSQGLDYTMLNSERKASKKVIQGCVDSLSTLQCEYEEWASCGSRQSELIVNQIKNLSQNLKNFCDVKGFHVKFPEDHNPPSLK